MKLQIYIRLNSSTIEKMLLKNLLRSKKNTLICIRHTSNCVCAWKIILNIKYGEYYYIYLKVYHLKRKIFKNYWNRLWCVFCYWKCKISLFMKNVEMKIGHFFLTSMYYLHLSYHLQNFRSISSKIVSEKK